MRRFLIACAGLSLLLAQGTSARAQGSSSAVLYPPDPTAFPTISALFDVYDANGIFATGLKAEAVTVREGGEPIAPTSLAEMAVPVQLVVSVNQGSGLDSRDPSGISRFERAMQVLSAWVQTRRADMPDDLSLVSQAGPVMNHGTPSDFESALRSFRPDLRAAVPNLQSLSIAIDIAAAQTPRAGMKRAVLFITPHMDEANIAEAVLPYIERALLNQVRIFVWFLDADLYAFTPSAEAFNSLAFGTGGSLFGYSGETPFPDPETYFSALRRVYALSYTSAVRESGDHQVVVEVKLGSGVVQSPQRSFALDLQPPNPILVNPALQITRQAPPEDPFNDEMLLPSSQPVEVLVEFPDRHPRQLVRTTLYADGSLADENTSAPFELFTWDLTTYQVSGEHQLVVEAVDELGLSSTSISIPVTVTVIQPPRGPSAFLARYRQPITIGAISLAGLALLAILLTGRLRVPSIRAAVEARRMDRDPVTQPVPATLTVPGSITKDKPKRRAGRKSEKTTTPTSAPVEAPASLLRLTTEGQPAAASPIPVAAQELTIGTDPAQSNLVFTDASLSPLHARIRRTEDEGFLLLDADSVAGTWANFELVPREGHRLQHGDMVHFGRLGFRFTLKSASEAASPRIEIVDLKE